MKKKGIYIILTFIFMFLFNIELEALTCTYENPYDKKGKDIVLEFSMDYDQVGYESVNNIFTSYNSKTTTCLNASKSSFMGSSFEMRMWDTSQNTLGQYAKTLYFTVDGKNFTFSHNDFKGRECTRKILDIYDEKYTGDGNEITCPPLEILPMTVSNFLSDLEYINVIEERHTIPDWPAIPLVLKSGTSHTVDGDKNVSKEESEKKSIGTCNYDLDVSRMHGNGSTFTEKNLLEVHGYNDGSTEMHLDNVLAKLDYTSNYPFDVYTNKRQGYFLMYKDDVYAVKTQGEYGDYWINCLKSGYVYYDKNLKSSSGHKGVYVITFSKEDIPNNAEYVMFGEHNVTMPEYGKLQFGGVSSTEGFCTSYLGELSNPDSLASLLDVVYTIIKVVSIIIVILWSMLDMAKVITKDKDELMPTVKKCVTRLIILLIILLLPAMIDMIGNLFGKEDILCGIK